MFRFGSDKEIKVTGVEGVYFQDVNKTEENGKVQLRFDDDSVLTIGEDARIEIGKMIYDPVKNTRDVLVKQLVGKRGSR